MNSTPYKGTHIMKHLLSILTASALVIGAHATQLKLDVSMG